MSGGNTPPGRRQVVSVPQVWGYFFPLRAAVFEGEDAVGFPSALERWRSALFDPGGLVAEAPFGLIREALERPIPIVLGLATGSPLPGWAPPEPLEPLRRIRRLILLPPPLRPRRRLDLWRPDSAFL